MASQDNKFDQLVRIYLDDVTEKRGRVIEDIGAFLYHLKEGVEGLRKLYSLLDEPAEYTKADLHNIF